MSFSIYIYIHISIYYKYIYIPIILSVVNFQILNFDNINWAFSNRDVTYSPQKMRQCPWPKPRSLEEVRFFGESFLTGDSRKTKMCFPVLVSWINKALFFLKGLGINNLIGDDLFHQGLWGFTAACWRAARWRLWATFSILKDMICRTVRR